MNFNQLEYFISAAEHLNFTKAAQDCFISQTAMTQQMQALERTLGVSLFTREKKKISLTPAGAVYLKEAKAILKRSDEAMRLARLASSGNDGVLTIGFISGFGGSDGYELLRGFHDVFPNIRLKFLRNTTSGLMHLLQEGECDVAFTLQPHRLDDASLNRLYIRSYPMQVALPASHPLAERTELTCKDLADESFILMQPAARSRDEMEEMLWVHKRGGFLPQVVGVEAEPETILLMVAFEIGISLLPEYILRPYAKNKALRILPLMKEDGSAEMMNFEMLWTKSNANPAVGKMLGWLDEAL